MQNLLEMGVKSHEAWLKSEFYHICLSVYLCAIDVWSRSSFRVTPCRLPQCWCRQNNWSCTEISPFTDCNKTHFCCKFWIHSLDMKLFYRFKWCKWPKMAFKCPRNFCPPPWILQKIFIFDQQQLQTESNWAHLLLMVISLAQTLLSRAKFRQLRVIKKDIILLTLDWLWGRLQALLQWRNVSSVRVSLTNGTKWTPSHNWGNLLSELHGPHKQCLTGISNAFSASFTNIWPSFLRFYCTPNKACLLCATPAGTYRVQSPGFPKII